MPPRILGTKKSHLGEEAALDWIGCLSGNLLHPVLRWVKAATLAFLKDAMHREALAKEPFVPFRSDFIEVFNFHICIY